MQQDPKSKNALKNLQQIPGVGKSISQDLYNIGITDVKDLIGKKAEDLFDKSNKLVGKVQDRCLLYVFRCAIYYAETPLDKQEKEKLKWWYWKD